MAIMQKSISSSLKPTIILVLLLIFMLCIKAGAQTPANTVKKIVIDAGHGGVKVGAAGLFCYEKDIVLQVSLQLGKLIREKLQDVEVIYTRETDVDVELYKRADIANKQNADLFISIHTNAGPKGDHESAGYETWIMGSKTEANMELVMRENSVIRYENNYKEIYGDLTHDMPEESDIIYSLMQASFIEKSIKFAEFVQNEFKGGPISIDRGLKQGPLIVLWRTAAPSALIEIGFISNREEEKKLADAKVQKKIAESIFAAVEKYRNYINGIGNYVDAAKEANSISTDTQDISNEENKLENNKDANVNYNYNYNNNINYKTTDKPEYQPKKKKDYKWLNE
jgi:N-acetylmuramoyl-L-alanine amidase